MPSAPPSDEWMAIYSEMITENAEFRAIPDGPDGGTRTLPTVGNAGVPDDQPDKHSKEDADDPPGIIERRRRSNRQSKSQQKHKAPACRQAIAGSFVPRGRGLAVLQTALVFGARIGDGFGGHVQRRTFKRRIRVTPDSVSRLVKQLSTRCRAKPVLCLVKR